MTFYRPRRRFSIAAVILLCVIVIGGLIFFFAMKTCQGVGFMRSNKTSEATDLYQIWPSYTNENTICISIEGIFHTTIYEQNGGITQRSGSTDIRISTHDLSTGALIARETLGDYSDGMSRILGLHENTIWMYDPERGLYARDRNDLHILLEQKEILTKNNALSSGLAQANKYLTNLNELYAYDAGSNALMVTTVTGKQLWVDATTFSEVTRPEKMDAMKNLMQDPERTLEEMIKNGTYDPGELTETIISMVSDMSGFNKLDVVSNEVELGNGCRIKFDGKTMTELKVVRCPDSIVYGNYACIQGNFLTNDMHIPEPEGSTFKRSRPVLFAEDPAHLFILHKDKIAGDAHDIVSCIDIKSGKTIWDADQFPLLNQTGSLEKIFTRDDQLILIWKIKPRLDDFFVCLSYNAHSGALLWNFTF